MNNKEGHIFSWGDTRRFNSYNAYFTKQFGSRVQKISIDAGFSCPNRDGKISIGGCTFCSNEAFNPSYCKPEKSIRQQIEEGISFHKTRYRRANQYLAYFQPYSNTYKPLEELENIYRKALEVNDIAGIVIGTRPDIIDQDVLHLLKTIQKSHYVMVEYGIESVYDSTLAHINRGHDFETAKRAVTLTAENGIPCGGHFIFGLPNETKEMMLNSAIAINSLPLTTIKFHQLQIFKGTLMAEEFQRCKENFHLFDLEEYIDFIIDFTEKLRPDLVIERFAGEVPPRYLLSEPWMKIRYDEVLHKIEVRMEERDSYQGKNFQK
jgi:radical SAM protein, TIGR01212 family